MLLCYERVHLRTIQAVIWGNLWTGVNCPRKVPTGPIAIWFLSPTSIRLYQFSEAKLILQTQNSSAHRQHLWNRLLWPPKSSTKQATAPCNPPSPWHQDIICLSMAILSTTNQGMKKHTKSYPSWTMSISGFCLSSHSPYWASASPHEVPCVWKGISEDVHQGRETTAQNQHLFSWEQFRPNPMGDKQNKMTR